MPSRLRRAALAIPVAWLMQASGSAGADATSSAAWIRIVAGGGLSLQAPHGSRFVQGRGADSLSGTVSGPGFALDLDYGAFSDPLTSVDTFSRVAADETLIDGRPARMVFATLTRPAGNRLYFFGLHVPSLAPGVQGSLKLTVTAHLRHTRELILIRRIVETIRFEPRQ